MRVYLEEASDEPYLDMAGFAREWRKRESVPIQFATPIDYFRELEKVRSKLPKVRGIVDSVGWPFWYGSCGSRGLDNWRDRNARDLVEAEIWCSLGSLFGIPYPSARIESLWREKLTLDPHDGLYVGEEDVMELIALGRHVTYECNRLGEQVRRHISRHIAVDAKRQSVVLFNPMSWHRTETLEIRPIFALPGTNRVRVLDSKGREIPHQLLRVRHMGKEKLYYKEAHLLVRVEVPALGYTTLFIEPAEGIEEPLQIEGRADSIESDSLRIRLGSEGIVFLEDKVHGVHYAGAGNPAFYWVNDMWKGRGGPVTGSEKIRGARWTVIERGPMRSSARMEARLGPHKISMLASLDHHSDRVDFDLSVDSKGGDGYLAVEVPFPYAGTLQAGVPFGAEVRDLAAEPFGPEAGFERLRENVFYAHHWVDYSDGAKGLTCIAAEGKRGFHYDPALRVLGHILLLTLVPHPPEKPNRSPRTRGEMESYFSNRFFPGTGKHRFQYSLLPHAGDWRTARSLFRAQENVYPIRWVDAHPRAGADLPLEQSLFRLTPGTVVVSSWLQEGGSHQLRLYESNGQPAQAQLRLPFRAASCRSVDFNGRPWPRPQLALSGDIVRFDLGAGEIVTLRFTEQGDRA